MAENDGWSKPATMLIASPPVLLLVSAILFVLLGTSGGFTLWGFSVSIADPWRVVLTVLGTILFWPFWILYHANSQQALSAKAVKSFGIVIKEPLNDSVVANEVEVVKGEFKKPIPEGYEIRLLRGFSDGSTPNSAAAILKHENKTWKVSKFYVPGKKKEHRRIEVWLVGPNGCALLDLWIASNEVVYATNRKVEAVAPQEQLKWLPSIKRPTSDMHLCHHIDVEIK